MTEENESGDSGGWFDSLAIRERTSSARERLAGIERTETVWEAEEATSIPIAEELEAE